MNIVDLLLSELEPMVVLKHYQFNCISEGENEIRACCKIHNGNNPTAFVWNKENNLWFCYTGDCGGGDVFTLIQKLENIDFLTAAKKLAEILLVDITNVSLSINPNKLKRENFKWIEQQKKSLKNKTEIKEYELPYTKYYKEHGTFNRFLKETLEHFSSKFCNLYPLESTIVYNKLVIPIYNNTTLVGVALRSTANNVFPKWLFQPRELQVGRILYNLNAAKHYIREQNEVIIVEGIFDVWAFYEIGILNVVAIFGSKIKQEQYATLLKLNTTVTLCFDNDSAGLKGTDNAIKVLKNKTELKTIDLPKDKDPADCSKEELLNAYLKRTKVQE